MTSDGEGAHEGPGPRCHARRLPSAATAGAAVAGVGRASFASASMWSAAPAGPGAAASFSRDPRARSRGSVDRPAPRRPPPAAPPACSAAAPPVLPRRPRPSAARYRACPSSSGPGRAAGPPRSPAMVVPAPPVVTSAEQRGSSASCASQSRTCTFGACGRDRARPAAACGQDRLVGRTGQAGRRGAQEEGVLVVRGALGHVHPGPVGRERVEPLRRARRVGRVPEQRADVTYAGRQVVAVEVELGDARHQVERQPAQHLVDRALRAAAARGSRAAGRSADARGGRAARRFR